jgi:hypothetical protein
MASLFSKTISLKKEFTISVEEFKQLRDFIYDQSGIYIADNRKYLLENRLRNRLKQLNLKSFGEYYYFLQYDAAKKQELNRLFEVVTTNETSFFRNPPQLKVFQENVLKELVAKQRKKGDKRIRIWSAGCSTGEEPYTMAIQLHEVLKGEIGSWNIRITANDLSEGVLASARRGVYTDYALRTTPPNMLVLRPADANETKACLQIALTQTERPSCLMLTRQGLPVIDPATHPSVIDGPAKGGYVLQDCEGDPEIVIMGSGSEVSLGVKTAELLEGKRVRIVSMPSMELFEEQSDEYRASVIPASAFKVAVEAGRPDLWYKFAGTDGLVYGLSTFGDSAPGGVLEKEYGFTPENLAGLIREKLA